MGSLCKGYAIVFNLQRKLPVEQDSAKLVSLEVGVLFTFCGTAGFAVHRD
jgi:hypothetical protein